MLAGEAECALAVGFEEIPPGAPDRIFPDYAEPLERYRDLVATATARAARPSARSRRHYNFSPPSLSGWRPSLA